jgi:hypothetical protein
MSFVDGLLNELRKIFGEIKTTEKPLHMTSSIRGAFHMALLTKGWEHNNGLYRKQGYHQNRMVQMADAIRAEKHIG